MIKTKMCKKKELFEPQISLVALSVVLVSLLTVSLLKCGDVEVNPGPSTKTSKQHACTERWHVQYSSQVHCILIFSHVHPTNT